jgi:predicted Zn-dependent protease
MKSAALVALVALTPSSPPSPSLHVDPAAVHKAMQDELARTMSDLRLGDEPRPYYVAYTISDLDQSTVSATFGAITAAHGYRGRVLRTDLRVGDASFDNTNFEGGGSHVEALPLEDDYAALRRELWLRTDEAYKAGLEALARKRAAAAGQADGDQDDAAVSDFSQDPPARFEAPFAAAEETNPEALRATVTRLSALFREFPKIYGSRVTATWAVTRRRMASSEGAWIDDSKRTVHIEVTAETQADDGMRLRSFVPFSALTPAGLPPLAEMEKGVRAMAGELTAMRTAPIASSGAGAVLFEGMAAAQLAKLLLADQLSGTPPPKTTSAGSDDGGQQSALGGKLGQRVAAPILSAFDDPAPDAGPGKVALFGGYHVDDEGVPAQRVSLVEHGMLKSLLMTRTPRREILRSNGHARAARFAGPHAHIGTLFITGKTGLPRKGLIDELAKISRAGGVTTYVVRLLDDGSLPGGDDADLGALLFSMGGSHGPPPVRPLVAYRVVGGKEELVRGLALENLVPRTLKDVTAVGKDPIVYNYMDLGAGFSGIPSSIVTPALLVADVDVRKLVGKNRKPPLYPPPSFPVDDKK